MDAEARVLEGVAAIALVLFLVQAGLRPPAQALIPKLPHPPSPAWVRVASLDEPIAAAGLVAVWLQSFDERAGRSLPLSGLDYDRLEGWLDLLLALDARGDTPLVLASHVYAQVADAGKSRRMLDWTYRAFLADPKRRWRFAAHAALAARYRLHDLALALRYARGLAQHATEPDLPHWARQMPAWILQEMGELEAARMELAGWLASPDVTDPNERRFLAARLEEIERALSESRRPRRPSDATAASPAPERNAPGDG